MLSYEGIFFDKDTADFIHSLEKPRLPIVNDELHCTFKYHPQDDEIFDELVGKEMEVSLIGYGNDGNNSGFEIQIPNEMMPYYINYDDGKSNELKIPHVTASLSSKSEPFKTKDLKFEKLKIPYKIKGKFGYWIKENGKEYKSFEHYKKKQDNSTN